MDNTEVYRVRRPSLIPLLVYISLLMGIQLFQIYNLNYRYTSSDNLVLSCLLYGQAILCFIVAIVLVYRIFTIRRVVEIQIQPESILIEDLGIEAERINDIYIKGYFSPVVGIRPKVNKFVPYKLCFNFLSQKDEDEIMKQLKAWAERNQIKVTHKNFSRWL
ncbi:hypothetical protein NYE25_10380 [Paenibacillus sp. FSL E2-8871]|uniref:DUF304 domain-containing protein n=1 Tax=Paenibacillus odorifer TaxID=189426 RepID=A0A1R0Z9Z9_9BACL|nr:MULTISPECIES: hypothetical protein [Paenibacillus]KAA1181863.1 hypothetical protein PAENI_24220 [Paenibacillus sp. B2(2019)]OMD37186.1 hypothetical protein BSK52_22195 [Paenibacillus odorifer]OMD47640.1 hypothetical protein BSK51_24015 [Paenibacillus odorifer]OME64998.1 hypothetical protein BSK65_26260 [Paenibacillus odorifer]